MSGVGLASLLLRLCRLGFAWLGNRWWIELLNKRRILDCTCSDVLASPRFDLVPSASRHRVPPEKRDRSIERKRASQETIDLIGRCRSVGLTHGNQRAGVTRKVRAKRIPVGLRVRERILRRHRRLAVLSKQSPVALGEEVARVLHGDVPWLAEVAHQVRERAEGQHRTCMSVHAPLELGEVQFGLGAGGAKQEQIVGDQTVNPKIERAIRERDLRQDSRALLVEPGSEVGIHADILAMKCLDDRGRERSHPFSIHARPPIGTVVTLDDHIGDVVTRSDLHKRRGIAQCFTPGKHTDACEVRGHLGRGGMTDQTAKCKHDHHKQLHDSPEMINLKPNAQYV